MDIRKSLLERFLRYVSIPSQSKAGEKTIPSTVSQWDLAKVLYHELRDMGLQDLSISDNAVIIARLPSNLNHKAPTVGWVAHMDTVDVCLSPMVHPILVKDYDGWDVVQNREKNIILKAMDHPELQAYLGDDILFSDGTSVLGADDKAAIANIMTALEYLLENKDVPHGDIYVAFVPDEEVGLKGAKVMDYTLFPVDYAYTIDCCALGEVVYETFNAGSASLKVKGVTAHPMSSKGNLVNPTLVAVDYVNLLDRKETPENTEGKEGFIWVGSIVSDALNATVSMNIRDHSREKYEEKKRRLLENLETIRKMHPKAEVELKIEDVYSNILDSVRDENRMCIDFIYEALAELGIEPKTIAMRGGTDGSFISKKGIPTPNYFTGAHNFHSSSEFLPLSSFEKSCLLTLKLVEKAAKAN